MKTILYIDLFSSLGHVQFNKNYLNSLNKTEANVKVVLKKGYIYELGFPDSILELSIPVIYFKDYKNSILNRFQLLKILWFIKNNLDFEKYDLILFSGYEEISLFFSNIKSKVYLVNHNNISGLDNPIKRFFFKKISKKNTHIVFDEFIKERLIQIGIKNILVIPFGLTNRIPQIQTPDIPINLFNEFSKPLCNYKYILFSPSATSVNKNLINDLIKSNVLITYLEKNEILFVIKGNFCESISDNIIIINRFMSEIQYQNVFSQSDIILLCYPTSFKYRISSVFIECISNNKLCLITDIQSFKIYKSYLNFDPFFSDEIEFTEKLKELISQKQKTIVNWYNNTDNLTPNFDLLLNET